MDSKIIAVDFGDTIMPAHSQDYEDTIKGAKETLTDLVDNGHKIVLWTRRDNNYPFKGALDFAVKWFKENEIPLYGINAVPDEAKISNSPKIPYDYLIDNRNVDTKLRKDGTVKWKAINKELEDLGLL